MQVRSVLRGSDPHTRTGAVEVALHDPRTRLDPLRLAQIDHGGLAVTAQQVQHRAIVVGQLDEMLMFE